MRLAVRVSTAVAVILVTLAAAAPIPPEALRHSLVPGERFVYESTEGGPNTLLPTRTELTVLDVTPARTTVREREFRWDRLSAESSIRTDAAQRSWHYTGHEQHAPSIVPIWDPERYGTPPAKADDHRVKHTRDGDQDVSAHVRAIAADAITITVEGTYRTKPAQSAVGDQTVVAASRMEMTWRAGVLTEYRYTTTTTVTVNGRALPPVQGQTIHRLVEHTVPP